MKKQKIDIVIADDHKLFRKGICSLMSDFSFINRFYEAGNGVEVLQLLEKAKKIPDLILLDLKMPEMDGIKTNRMVKALYPEIKIIILTMQDDEQFILHMVNEGVNGYLMKNAEPDELEKAIINVMTKDFYFPEEISKIIYKNWAKKEKKTSSSRWGFTPREMETLELICKEYTAQEIATELNLSVRTVEGYRSSLLDKSGSKNIAGLVVYAITNNLVYLHEKRGSV